MNIRTDPFNTSFQIFQMLFILAIHGAINFTINKSRKPIPHIFFIFWEALTLGEAGSIERQAAQGQSQLPFYCNDFHSL